MSVLRSLASCQLLHVSTLLSKIILFRYYWVDVFPLTDSDFHPIPHIERKHDVAIFVFHLMKLRELFICLPNSMSFGLFRPDTPDRLPFVKAQTPDMG